MTTPATRTPIDSRKPIRQQFADTMLAVGQEDERLVVMVGDISHFVLQPFAQACPGRYYNVGICEPTIVSMAAGLSKVGLVPVVHTIAPFIVERAFEQIKLDFGYHRLGGNLVTVGGAFDYSNLGSTHHCYGDWALVKTVEGSEIVFPGSADEFDTLFRQVYDDGALTLIRVPAVSHGLTFPAGEVRFGRGIRLAAGSDATIVVTGAEAGKAVEARARLAALGIDVDLLYIHTIRPLDVDLIRESVARTGRVLVVEEHMRSGGLGDDVLRALAGTPFAYASLAIPDVFVRSYGTYEEHCEELGFTVDGIVDAVTGPLGLGR